MNAIDYIKQSVFYTSKKYAQIRPLVDKVVTDQLADRDLDGVVDVISPLGTSSPQGIYKEPSPSPASFASGMNPVEPAPTRIKAIKRLSNAKNVALIKQSPPIELADGLNIFYGHNGDGKTTFYRAISNCLGLSEHPLDNVDSRIAQQPYAHLVVEDMQGNSLDLVWPSDKAIKLDPVRRFDANICLALVEDDQDTTFSLVHFKQEYFALIGDALKKLSVKIEERSRVLSERLNRSAAAIDSAAPELRELLPSLGSVKLENASISEEERKSLKGLEASLQTLEKDELPGKIVVLTNDICRLDEILSSVGQSKTNADATVSKWELVCTQSYFDDTGRLITAHNNDSATLDERASTLVRFITEAWLKNRQWRGAVTAIMSYVRSLQLPDQRTYREQRCPYCQQPLSQDAKELLLAYEDVFGDVKQRLDRTEADIVRALEDAQQRSERLRTITYKETLISEEGKCLRGGETFHLSHVLDILNQAKTSLVTKSLIRVAPQETENIAIAFSHYRNWREALITQKDSYKKMVENKVEEANKLRLQIGPLRERQLLVDSRAILEDYLSLREGLVKLARFRDLLTEAKRQESLLGTQFSSQMIIREFEKALDREYDSLGFQKPRRFSLGCKTSTGTTKRVYTIGDRRFRDVLSEGEQKQHALADFFAQIEVEGYDGLVVLDDPVTSLDELNTEMVARRIVDLNERHGNQIVVFTHNVFFLNSLTEITHNDKVVRLSKSANEIIVLPNAQLGGESALRHRKNQIQEKLNAIAQDPLADEVLLRSIYDLLSGHIEIAAETRLLKDVVGRYRPNVRIQSLTKVQWDSAAVGKLVELYNRTSRKCTRHSQPLSVPAPTRDECLADAKEIMDLVGAL